MKKHMVACCVLLLLVGLLPVFVARQKDAAFQPYWEVQEGDPAVMEDIGYMIEVGNGLYEKSWLIEGKGMEMHTSVKDPSTEELTDTFAHVNYRIEEDEIISKTPVSLAATEDEGTQYLWEMSAVHVDIIFYVKDKTYTEEDVALILPQDGDTVKLDVFAWPDGSCSIQSIAARNDTGGGSGWSLDFFDTESAYANDTAYYAIERKVPDTDEFPYRIQIKEAFKKEGIYQMKGTDDLTLFQEKQDQSTITQMLGDEEALYVMSKNTDATISVQLFEKAKLKKEVILPLDVTPDNITYYLNGDWLFIRYAGYDIDGFFACISVYDRSTLQQEDEIRIDGTLFDYSRKEMLNEADILYNGYFTYRNGVLYYMLWQYASEGGLDWDVMAMQDGTILFEGSLKLDAIPQEPSGDLFGEYSIETDEEINRMMNNRYNYYFYDNIKIWDAS